MSRKSKGIEGEREIIHKFHANGWSAVRIAGSGSMRYPSPDILASNNIRNVAIECKRSKEGCKYIGNGEIEQLKEFSDNFGAEMWLGIKFDRDEWYFIMPEDAEITPRSYKINKDILKLKGLLFEEFISK